MLIKKIINSKISGFYDIGKRYSLDLYAKDLESFEELKDALPKNMKTIDTEIINKHNGIRLMSYNISDIFKYQKSRGISFPLEHL